MNTFARPGLTRGAHHVHRTGVVVVMAAALLAGCTGGSDEDGASPKGASTNTIETPWREAAAGAGGDAFLAKLGDIGPGLDDKSSLTAVIKTCLDIWEGRDAVVTTSARFSGAKAGEVTDAQAEAIVKAAQEDICTDL